MPASYKDSNGSVKKSGDLVEGFYQCVEFDSHVRLVSLDRKTEILYKATEDTLLIFKARLIPVGSQVSFTNDGSVKVYS